VHLKVLPINALGKNMSTKGTKHFHRDSIVSYLQISSV
jgi:hypothetical protein